MLRSMIVLSFIGLVSLPCLAQTDAGAAEKKPAAESSPKAFYQLNFVVQELENERVINSRSYSMIMRDQEPSSIRAGEKVPFASSSGVTTQWQQINVGVEIDCRNLEANNREVSLNVKADISSVTEGQVSNSTPASLPIIRNNQWGSAVILPMKQPTILFSSDDPASKRTMRLQLTVMPVRP